MDFSTIEHWQDINANGVIYDVNSLFAHFEALPDPRHAHGKRYHLTTLLVIIFMAKLCGQDTPVAIADWAQNHTEELVALLNLKRSWMPHHNTIRRVFQNTLAESEFERLARAYHQQERSGTGVVLALDGKFLRGTRLGGQASHENVVSVYDVTEHLVLAQTVVASKENEIVAAPRVLENLPIAGKIITGDAIHTQRALSQQLIDGGSAYIWPVKENQPRLLEDIQRLFAPDHPKPGFGKIQTDFLSASKVNLGHGRLEKRTIQTSEMLNDYVSWPGLQQVYRLERKFDWLRQGVVYKTSCEVEYGITSLSRSQASPARLLQYRRQHWFIETGLHYRRDVTFHEDATRMTIGSAGRILATIHNLVLGLIKRAGYTNAARARRFYAGHLEQAFALLITTKSRT